MTECTQCQDIGSTVRLAILETYGTQSLVEATTHQVLPEVADPSCEGRIAAALVDGRARLCDVEALSSSDFVIKIYGAIAGFYLEALRAGKVFALEDVAAAFEAQGIARAAAVIAVLKYLRDEVPVTFVPTLADDVARVRELAAVRSLFATTHRLDMATRLAAQQGADIPDPIPALRDAAAALKRVRGEPLRSNVRPIREARNVS